MSRPLTAMSLISKSSSHHRTGYECRHLLASAFTGSGRPGGLACAEVYWGLLLNFTCRTKHPRWKESNFGSLAKAVALGCPPCSLECVRPVSTADFPFPQMLRAISLTIPEVQRSTPTDLIPRSALIINTSFGTCTCGLAPWLKKAFV